MVTDNTYTVLNSARIVGKCRGDKWENWGPLDGKTVLCEAMRHAVPPPCRAKQVFSLYATQTDICTQQLPVLCVVLRHTAICHSKMPCQHFVAAAVSLPTSANPLKHIPSVWGHKDQYCCSLTLRRLMSYIYIWSTHS